MKKKRNPFKPTFGSVPAAMAGRDDIIEDILEGLDNAPGDPNRASVFVGARGTGKTVLMVRIAAMAEERGWIAVNVTSGKGLFEEIFVQISDKASHILDQDSLRRISGLSVAGLSVSFELTKEKSTWRSEMTKIISELNSNNVGLLITVDEINAGDEELKHLIDIFQHFVREERNVALLLAGLPSNVSSLLLDEKVSFIRRAFRHDMEAISITDVAYALKETVENAGRRIDDDALWMAAEMTEGFAFAIQLVGYHMWRQNPESEVICADDVERSVEFVKRDMKRAVIDTVMMEMTPKEKEFLKTMAGFEDDECSTLEISESMGISPNNGAHLRKRLIERGVITPAGRGKVRFAQSMMKEYLI